MTRVGDVKDRKIQRVWRGRESSRDNHTQLARKPLSLKGFLLCPLPCPQTLNRACLIYWLGNLLNVRESVCGEREKEKYTHRERERKRERESFQLQATGSEHPGLASLASHAFSYDISKLVTQLSNWHEKLSKAPNSHDYIVNPDLTPCFCPWESFFCLFHYGLPFCGHYHIFQTFKILYFTVWQKVKTTKKMVKCKSSSDF